jgi:hypothetical protein
MRFYRYIIDCIRKFFFNSEPKNTHLNVKIGKKVYFLGMTKRQKSALKFFTETEKIKH